MDTHFKIEFRTFTDFTTPITLKPRSLAYNLEDLYENDQIYTVTVKENHNLSVLFLANENTKLFIDFLDMYPEDYFENEDITDGVYISPDAEERILYSYKNHRDYEYPMLIPGNHKVVIQVAEQKYYMFLNVAPLRIEQLQLNTMREEVDKYLEGLAKKSRKKLYLNMVEFGGVDVHNTISIFVKHHKKIVDALIRIKENPKYKIEKKYLLKTTIEFGKTDSRTLMYMQRRNDRQNKILTYTNSIKYSVDENEMMKVIVNVFRKDLIYCLEYLDESIYRVKNERYNKTLNEREMKNLNDHKRKLNMLLVHIYNYLNADWNKEVIAPSVVMSPRKLLLSRNYRLLYKVYREMTDKSNAQNDISNNYLYFWKETSKLYEIWCFIKIMDLIEKCDYNMRPIRGWVYDERINENTFPFLDPNTRIVYSNDKDLEIVIYYDSDILSMLDTTLENPLFTNETHKTPDLRIDVYKSGFYKKSVIGDFKYRAYDSLERFNSFNKNRNQSKVYKQLFDYSQASSSFVNSNVERNRSDSAIHETWVFYPTTTHKKGTTGHDRETNIRRIELSPAKEQNIILSHLNRVIGEIINE